MTASPTQPLWRGMLALCAAGALAWPAHHVAAQATGGDGVSAGLSREVARARALIERGDGADARAVLDSLVGAAPLASLDLAEALYWRAVLAERIGDAERDWKRLVIEAPLSPRTPDALLRLGELDMLRGHPADARPYFERVVREFPDSARIARGTIWLVRSYFDESELPRGCQALRALPAGSVPEGELRLQADELRRRCTSVVTTASAAPATTSTAPKATAPTPVQPAPAPVESTTTKASGSAAAASGRFSVQLAAFDTRKEADASVARLKRAGVEARVDGSRKPFRVRTGRYETRAEATAALAKLKKQGQGGFVAEISP